MKIEDNKELHEAAKQAENEFNQAFNNLDDALIKLAQAKIDVTTAKKELDEAWNRFKKSAQNIVNADAMKKQQERRERYYS